MSAFYLYGFVPETTDDAVAEALEGVSGGAVTIERHAGLGVVVEAVDATRFTGELQANLDDHRWLAQRAIVHESVVRAFVGEGDVSAVPPAGGICPLRFGTVVPDRASLTELLEQQGPHMRAALERLAGFREFTVKLWLPSAAAEAAALERDAALRRQRSELADVSEGRAYLLARRFEKSLAAAVADVVDELYDEASQQLARIAERTVPSDRLPEDQVGMESVAHVVCLLNAEQEIDVNRWLDSLLDDLDARGTLSGPFAPYHFLDIVTSAGDVADAAPSGDPHGRSA